MRVPTAALSVLTEACAEPALSAMTTTRICWATCSTTASETAARVDRHAVDAVGEVEDLVVGVGAVVRGEQQHLVAGGQRL